MKLSYQDCKELKDAGFPQKRVGMYLYDKEGNLIHLVSDRDWSELDSDIKIPTLSELIEACGVVFHRLVNQGATWEAYSSPDSKIGVGDSPEQAVKNLWIALNKI